MFFGNHQPSRGLFENYTNPSLSSAHLFSPESNQGSHLSSTNSFQSHSASTNVPTHGTVDYIGKPHIHYIHEYNQQDQYACITGTILGCSLEELRIQDHFNLKQNLLPGWKRPYVNLLIKKNTAERDKNNGISLPQSERQFRTIIPFEKVTRIPWRRDQPLVVSSNPGSFSTDVNKMVLVSSLVSLLRKHKMSIPENLLDDTDFVSQFFIFLGHYKVKLPAENIPKFSLTDLTPETSQSSAPVVQPQTSTAVGKKKTKKSFKRFSNKKSKNEKLCKIKAPPEKEVPAEATDAKNSLIPRESRLSLETQEEEKDEVRDEKDLVQKDHLKDEDGGKKEGENVVKNLENRDEASKAGSVGSSEENLSYEEVISIPKNGEN